MNLGRLSVNQPILAMVLSIVLLIVGAIAYTTLPVAEYPQVVPPTVVVTTQYPGASAQTVSDTVAAPIEQQINGVENMLYMSSTSSADGSYFPLTITFESQHQPGLCAGARAEPRRDRAAAAARRGAAQRRRHPQEQPRHPDGRVHAVAGRHVRPALHQSNYALLQVRDQLLRLDGVGDIQIFGARDYSMRLWLDPDKIATLGLTAGEVIAAIRVAERADRGWPDRRTADCRPRLSSRILPSPAD